MNQLTYSIIIPCAGKSSRFNSQIPKPLTTINGKVSLNILLSNLDSFFKKIIIPIPPGSEMLELFESRIESRFLPKISFVASSPGRGDGGAIIDGMKILQTQEEHFFVCWGDTYIVNKSIFFDLLKYALSDNLRSFAYIPLIFLKDPYVSYMLDKNKYIVEAQQSIDGYKFESGFADQSIFMLSKNIAQFLKISALKYTSPAGQISEISLLKSFKTMAEKNFKLKPMIRAKKDSFSFNTKEDLVFIKSL